MMPGCRKVRSLRAAFLAKGSRDLLRTISKVKTLHDELSSYNSLSVMAQPLMGLRTYSFRAIV
jgi:hypothetical protein